MSRSYKIKQYTGKKPNIKIIHTYINAVSINAHLQLYYLTEEMSLLLFFEKAREVTVNHQMRVIQHCVEPAPGRKQRLHVHKTGFKRLNMLVVKEKIIDFKH